MARIAGVDIPRDKRLEISLTYIFGTGRTRSKETCAALDIDPDTRVRDLTDGEGPRIRHHREADYKAAGGRRRDSPQDIKRKTEIGCWQALRHRRGLPVRGRRAQTTARTRKGPRKTVAGKKKVRK